MKEWFIKHAESHEVIQKYYALNNVIEKRVKEENREVGEQVIVSQLHRMW
ncbi:9817_t:CDS:2 [Rhizophagus irregularis]|nr:9817_t:CDS:2 [Rhizophagus irregularis]